MTAIKNNQKLIFIMVDGFGLPPEGYLNSAVYNQYCNHDFLKLLIEYSTPLDASLDMPGIPQSATGQSSLFCGLNTAKMIGMHLQGFPCPQLRSIIREQNIFKALIKRGKSACFANAYVYHTLEELAKIGMRSVTTVMMESELGIVRTHDDLINGNAVFHDMTRQLANDDVLRRYTRLHVTDKEKKYCPEITPEEAACDLRNISRNHDFTLYEYFLTDRAGHKRKEEFLAKALGEFSSFIAQLTTILDHDQLLIMTSDHGNIEDISIKSHSKNPVPFLVFGKNTPTTPPPTSLQEVYNYILNII